MQSSKDLRLRALKTGLDLARRHVAEQGANNRGPVVDEIIRYADGQLGEPWCVDFVIYCYGKSGSHLMAPGASRAVRFMANPPGVHVTRHPKPGSPLRFVFDHTGLVVGFRRQIAGRFVKCPRWLASHVKTVEGNTSFANSELSDSRDGGDGVYVKVRPISVVQDYLYVTA